MISAAVASVDKFVSGEYDFIVVFEGNHGIYANFEVNIGNFWGKHFGELFSAGDLEVSQFDAVPVACVIARYADRLSKHIDGPLGGAFAKCESYGPSIGGFPGSLDAWLVGASN